MLSCIKCLFWSVKISNAESFCFIFAVKSFAWFCKFRHFVCHIRISSACACSSCGSSAFELSYLASAESWRLCSDRSKRFSFINSYVENNKKTLVFCTENWILELTTTCCCASFNWFCIFLILCNRAEMTRCRTSPTAGTTFCRCCRLLYIVKLLDCFELDVE